MDLEKTAEQPMRDYSVHVTLGYRTDCGSARQTGFASGCVRAHSEESITKVVKEIERKLKRNPPRDILEAEVLLEDGWHYFDKERIDPKARGTPQLRRNLFNKVYSFETVAEPPSHVSD